MVLWGTQFGKQLPFPISIECNAGCGQNQTLQPRALGSYDSMCPGDFIWCPPCFSPRCGKTPSWWEGGMRRVWMEEGVVVLTVLFYFNDQESISVFSEDMCMCVYQLFVLRWVRSWLAQISELFALSAHENTDFEINCTKPLSLGFFMSGQMQAKAGGAREGPKGWGHLPHLKGAAFEWPQTGWARGSTAQRAQTCWFPREARNPDIYVKLPTFKMLANNSGILCWPLVTRRSAEEFSGKGRRDLKCAITPAPLPWQNSWNEGCIRNGDVEPVMFGYIILGKKRNKVVTLHLKQRRIPRLYRQQHEGRSSCPASSSSFCKYSSHSQNCLASEGKERKSH